MLKLVHPAKPQGQENARPKGKKSIAFFATPEERARIGAALRSLAAAYGGKDVLAAVMGVSVATLGSNSRASRTYAMAVLLARAAGVPVEQILNPGVQEAGKCHVCGRKGPR